MPRNIPSPNYTQAPNAFYDEWIKEIDSLAELKVVEVVIRGTFGWHRERVKMSLADVKEATGLSKSSTQDGIKRALEHGYISRVKDGRSFSYEVPTDVPDTGIANLHGVPDTGTSRYRYPVPSSDEFLLEKESSKEIKTESGQAAPSPRKGSAKKPYPKREEWPSHVRHYFSITGRAPLQQVWPLIAQRIGPTPNLAFMHECYQQWIDRGNREFNNGWLDWYVAGQIPPRPGTRATPAASPKKDYTGTLRGINRSNDE